MTLIMQFTRLILIIRRVSEVPVETEFAGLKEKSLERLLLDLLLGPMLS